jgi:hypothetical protein
MAKECKDPEYFQLMRIIDIAKKKGLLEAAEWIQSGIKGYNPDRVKEYKKSLKRKKRFIFF